MIKRFAGILLCQLLILSLFGCTSQSGGYTGTVDGISFSLSDLGEQAVIHTGLQQQFIAEIKEDPAGNAFVYYAQGGEELSRPMPVTLTWTAKAEQKIEGYTVNISKNADMTNPVYTQQTEQTTLDVYNLEVGKTYYWTVTANLSDNQVTSGTACFTTDGQAPRNLYVDGITNVRDLGGWKTENGGHVKQGMIYRCGRLNESDVAQLNVEITEDGICAFRDRLGMKTEIDLRMDAEAANIIQSPMGTDVNYIRIPMNFAGDIIQDNREQIIAFFAVLAEEENYPLCIHCNIGTDRTGLLCFFVNALLGVSETELVMDYTFSNLGEIGSGRGAEQILEVYLPMVNEMDGKTLSEKTWNYLNQLGVAASNLDAVISIMGE